MEKVGRGKHKSPIPPCRWTETLQSQDLQKYLPRVWDPIPYISISIRGLTGQSGEYPVSPMDLNGNCCLHRAVGFSPGMDHLVDTAFSFMLLCLSSFFLLACLLYFFFSFFYFPILVKSYLYLWESYTLVCIILTNTQVPLDMNMLPPHVILFFLTWHPKHLPELSITETNPRTGGGDHE